MLVFMQWFAIWHTGLSIQNVEARYVATLVNDVTTKNLNCKWKYHGEYTDRNIPDIADGNTEACKFAAEGKHGDYMQM